MTEQRPPARPSRTRTATVAAVTGAVVLALTGLSARTAAPVVAAVTTQTVTAAADTYVDSSRPTTNFGSRSTIYADGDPSIALLVQFAIPATSQAFSKATLRLYTSSSSAQGLTVATTSATAWDEAGVTWATAPAATSQVGQVPSVSAGTWATLDLATAVVPGATLTLRVTTPGTRQVAVRSRESGAATTPQLVLQTTSSAPTPTPTPTRPRPRRRPRPDPDVDGDGDPDPGSDVDGRSAAGVSDSGCILLSVVP